VRLTPIIAHVIEGMGRLLRQQAPVGGRLQVISPLAEGADRLVARLALEHGAQLIVPLPLPRDVYAQDFSDSASVAEFSDLLGRATEIWELNGDGADAEHRLDAYAAAGFAVVDQSDVLLAMWDGEPAAGRGGTADIVRHAVESGKAVLWAPTVLEPLQLLVGDRIVTENALGAFLQQVGRALALKAATAP